MQSTWVIGDIHGACRALKQVMERAPVKPGDTLLFVGDYVDGWSEAVETVDYCIELQQTYNCIFLKGNHDVWMYEYLNEKFAYEVWLENGGAISKVSYDNATEEVWQRHRQFFNSLLLYYIDAEERLYVHAGFTSKKGVEGNSEDVLTNDRSLWELAVKKQSSSRDSLFYPAILKLYHEVYIGHSPTIRYASREPMICSGVINTDTGAAFDNKLSIINADTKEFWQSDVVLDLYPGETGRLKKNEL